MADYAKVLKIGNGNNQYQSNYGGGPLTLHRGVGERSSNTGSVTWSSPSKALAQGYADKRKNGKVETTTEEFKSVFDAGRDSQEMTPSKFAVSAMMQAKQRGQVSDKEALGLRADFLKDQTSESRNITDYWAREEGRGKVSSLLRGLGFDAVHILEGDTPTYGKLGKAKKLEYATILKVGNGNNQYQSNFGGVPDRAMTAQGADAKTWNEAKGIPKLGKYDMMESPLHKVGRDEEHAKIVTKPGDALDAVEMAPIRKVKVKDLKSLQGTVEGGRLSEWKDGAPPVEVMKWKGQHYLTQGNHRASAAWSAGKTEIDARVLDLDAPENYKLLKPAYRPKKTNKSAFTF